MLAEREQDAYISGLGGSISSWDFIHFKWSISDKFGCRMAYFDNPLICAAREFLRY